MGFFINYFSNSILENLDMDLFNLVDQNFKIDKTVFDEIQLIFKNFYLYEISKCKNNVIGNKNGCVSDSKYFISLVCYLFLFLVLCPLATC